MEQHHAQPHYPRRSKRAAKLKPKELNHYSYMGHFSAIKEHLGFEVWDKLKEFPVGVIAELFEGKRVWSAKPVHYLLCRQLHVEKKEIWSVVGDQPIRFSLLEFGEITGLNTDVVPTESFEPDKKRLDEYKLFWKELKVPYGLGPKAEELNAALIGCHAWSVEKRTWLGLLVLLAMGIYAGHHNTRIPFETAQRVFDDKAMKSYPWGRAAFEALVDSIKSANPEGRTYFISGMSYALLAWAFESVSCFEELCGKQVGEENQISLLRWYATRTRANFDTVLKKEIEKYGRVRVRHMVLKDSVEEMFPQWPDENEDPQLVNLIKDLHSGRYVPGDYWDVQEEEEKKKKPKLALVPVDSEYEPAKKKQKKDKKHERYAVIEMKEDAKGNGGIDSPGSLGTIVAMLEKFESRFDSKFTDMEKKMGGYVKEAVDERLKVLGFSESGHNYVQSSKKEPLPRLSVNSRTVATVARSETPHNVGSAKKPSVDKIGKDGSRTPQKYFPKGKDVAIPTDANTSDELPKADEKAVGSKLKAEIHKGTPEAKKRLFDVDPMALADFVGVSPAKEQPLPLRRRTRRQNQKHNAADDELKKKRSEAGKKGAAKRKENLKKKEEEKAAAKLKKKEEKPAAKLKQEGEKAAAESKKEVQITAEGEGVITNPIALLPESDEDEDETLRLGRIKKHRAKVVQLAATGLAVKSHAPKSNFPYVEADNGTTCMRKKDVEPSPAIYDPFSPVDQAKLDQLRQHLSHYEAIPLTDSSNDDAHFYRVLMTERAQWPVPNYGWLWDNHISTYVRLLIKRSMQDPSPFWSERIAFVDPWFLTSWNHEFKQFKLNAKRFNFKGAGYEALINGKLPVDRQTKKKWLVDVDHLYGVQNVGGDHWVAFHVDLRKEKIDAYDPIITHVTPESKQRMVDAFMPLLQMTPAMIEVLIHAKNTWSKKQFAFRWKSRNNIPQNTQSGDCGVYSLKLMECLALGVTFDGLSDVNIQGLRVKMAAEILDEGGYDMMGQFKGE